MSDLAAELHVSGTAEKPEIAGAVCRIDVPMTDVVRAFETRARVAVVATFGNGYVIRTSLMPRSGAHILPLPAEVCRGAGIRPGARSPSRCGKTASRVLSKYRSTCQRR